MNASTADAVLDLVRAAAPDAEAEVLVTSGDLGLTRFANSYIHQNVSDTGTRVSLRLHTGGRTATGATTLVDPDGLRSMVDRTVDAARLSPPDLRWAGLTTPTEVPSLADPDEATAAATPADRAARVRAFVDAAAGLESAGYCQTAVWTVTFANSAGHRAAARTAEASMDGIARDGLCDGLARLAVRRLADLDGALLGERAARKARAGRDPVELPPGRYEVVLEPTAVVDVLQMIGIYGFNGKMLADRRSFVEIGADQFDAAISLVDDPSDVDGAALPFDIEGTPRGRTVFADAGVSRTVAHDRRTAAQAGTGSTGHAVPGGLTLGPVPGNLTLLPAARPVLSGLTSEERARREDGASVAAEPARAERAPSSAAADASVAELVGEVGRGLLVTDNWYTRVLDPRTLVVTGLTRNGVWQIEDGVVTRPVQNLRFTQSYPRALAPGSVLGVGWAAPTLPSSWGPTMSYRAPALRLAAWNYTGNASG
jgi:predicted Zn-dependent protease